MLERPWYHEGLRFTCTECGDCCSGAPGYVWVTKQEIADLAAAMGYRDVLQFEAQHVRMVGVRRSLRERANYDCVLLDPVTRKCQAYDARPRQCRSWPFWDSNVDAPESWQRTCDVCPGSGRGRLYLLTEIENQRRLVRI